MVLTAIGPLLTEISKTFGLTMAQAGFLFTANFIGFSVFILFGGIAADYWGKKIVLSVSLGASAIFLALFPLSTSFYFACLVTFFIGGCSGIVESITNAIIVDLNSEKSGFYINLAQVFFGVGALLGPIIIGMALSAGVGWKTDYYVLSSIFLILTIVFIINKLPSLPMSDKISFVFLKTLLTDKKFLFFCLCMFFYTGSEVGGWGWMATFMQREFHFSLAQSSIAVGVFWAAIIVGRLICTVVNLRVSSRILIIILAYLSVVVTIISGLVKNEIEIWIVIIVLGLAFSGQWSLIVAYGSDHYKKSSGTVLAVFVGSGGIGMAVIPFIMGIIGQRLGIRASMMSTALCFLAIGMIFMMIDDIKLGKLVEVDNHLNAAKE
jgi:fucose permease